MASLWRAVSGQTNQLSDYDGVEFWSNPERTGCQLSHAPLGHVAPSLVASCLTVKGAEDVLNKQYAFELSTRTETMYFIADSEKEKEDWINSIGRSIVQHSRSVTDSEIVDYDSQKR
ncbi:hypothetical protein Patl1_06571 [Pistacia atlantica]|uniref:Uncharacterized protein n=1 Tax=Pistacia atlantica TaxID=434234 RepID=A0ACC1BSX5_9ROSI|nr:hypothetical protein Patl1_06571 [Pistacia atlantica]